MINDIKNFKETHGLLSLNISQNRLFVYIDKLEQVHQLDKFRSEYSKITILSLQPFDISIKKTIVKRTKRIDKKTHPIDSALYVILGKGFKDYDYYVTSLVFIK